MNIPPIEAVILDCDGTLIGASQEMTPGVVAVLRKAAPQIPIHLCTGRSTRWVVETTQALGITSSHIAEGGARIIDASGGILWEKLIPAKTTAAIFAAAQAQGFRIGVQIDGAEVPIWEPSDPTLAVSHLYISHADRAHVEKFLAFIESNHKDAHPILSHFQWKSNPIDWLVDVTAAGANKQHALLHLSKLNNFDLAKTMAVGDGYNDFPFLMACGFRIAMGNAVPELKAIADYVAPSIDDDGLVDVIERFILKK